MSSNQDYRPRFQSIQSQQDSNAGSTSNQATATTQPTERPMSPRTMMYANNTTAKLTPILHRAISQSFEHGRQAEREATVNASLKKLSVDSAYESASSSGSTKCNQEIIATFTGLGDFPYK